MRKLRISRSNSRNGLKLSHMTFMGEDGHGGCPKDISDVVLFLDSQNYITGQNFIVDGGRTLGPGNRWFTAKSDA